MARTGTSLLITLMAFADDIPYVRQHRNQELELVVVKRRVNTLEDTVSDDYNVERKGKSSVILGGSNGTWYHYCKREGPPEVSRDCGSCHSHWARYWAKVVLSTACNLRST